MFLWDKVRRLLGFRRRFASLDLVYVVLFRITTWSALASLVQLEWSDSFNGLLFGFKGVGICVRTAGGGMIARSASSGMVV